MWAKIADTNRAWGHKRRREDIWGFFRWSTRQKETNGKWQYNRKQKKIGELHLTLDKISGPLLAHEIQHIVGVRSRVMGWNAEGEPAARFAERLTRNFWNWFYKTFDSE